jgi:hypothetical protein
LRRASKRFWLLVSAAAVVVLAMQAGLRAGGRKRVNELTLAGLQPGKDALEKVDGRFGAELKIKTPNDPNSYSWHYGCPMDDLTVEAGPNGLIRNITVSVSHLTDHMAVDCSDRGVSRKFRSRTGSGRNLLLRDRCERIEEIYGKAESRSPSVTGTDKLELCFYKFEWAGTEVPQAMEVSCDASSQRVVEITLAGATL